MNWKKKSISLFASLLITFGIVVFLYLFQRYINTSLNTQNIPFLRICLFSIGVYIVNFFIINFLLSYYLKKELQKIVEALPKHEKKAPIVIDKISEEIDNLQTKNLNELELMRKMENYRKDFIGNLSHELKTPLFSIQGYVETLIDGGVNDLNIRDKYLQRINLSVERMKNLVEDLDMISQLEKGGSGIILSNFNLNLLVKEVFDLLDLDAKKNKANLQLITENEYYVKADKQKIFQVFVNILSNAIHYSKREQALIKVTLIEKNKRLLIRISDNGMGIKEDVLPRIFERFYRVDTSRSRKNGGSGLGLTIVKHILEAHHQKIYVESIYLEGTIFQFHLPLA